MKNRTEDEALMTRYLLGQLSEDEQKQIEESFFTDDSYYEQLLARENELAYDYAQGGLSAVERELFEKRFMRSDEGRHRVQLAEVLLERLSKTKKRTSIWLSSIFQYATAAVVLIAVFLSAWLYSELKLERSAHALLEQKVARQKPAPLPVVASLMLNAGLVRGNQDIPRLLVAMQVDIVQLQLNLRTTSNYATYRVVVRTADGSQVFSQDSLAPSASTVI